MSKASEELLFKIEQRLKKINEDISQADEKIAEWQDRKRKLLSEQETTENKRILMIVNLNNISGTQLKELLSPKASAFTNPVTEKNVSEERKFENEEDE